MKRLVQSTQYKKDLKRIRNDAKKAEALLDILTKLENEIPIPQENRPHLLTGDYKGYMECHIQGDFLLIWFDPDTDEIDLVVPFRTLRKRKEKIIYTLGYSISCMEMDSCLT